MFMNPNTQSAYDLFASGSIFLSRMEQRGMQIDVKYLKRESEKMAMRLAEMTKHILEDTEEGQIISKKYGKLANLNSVHHIRYALFTVKKYKLPDDGKSTDDAALVRIGTPFCKKLGAYRSLSKARGTYVENILRQAVQHDDGLWFLHPTFGLMLVSTYRSSSYDPNLQNIPIRDPEVGKLVRSAFLPRPGFQLMEIDYSGAEVCCGAAYHKDPNMIEYIIDPSTDMHRDTAADCYITSTDEVSKDMRFYAKNKFVFAEFYGDWYKPCARNLWEAIDQANLKTASGVGLKKHLRIEGIKNLDQFTTHMKEVERIMWEERFGVYQQWKDDTYAAYVRNGYYHTKTGFTIQGLLDKKQVCNSPIQGSAFHWLLWSANRLDNWMIRNNLESRLVGQVHDSMIGDIHPDEKDYVAEKAIKIMTKDIYEQYPWINVPLKADIDLCPVDGSWYEKEPYDL